MKVNHEGCVSVPCVELSFPSHSFQFCCLLAIPFLLTKVVIHWKGEPKSHYISLVVAVAAESHYSSLTVSKRAAVLGYAGASHSLSHHAPLAGNCLILQQTRGETAVTPMHVSLSGLKARVSQTNAALGLVAEHCLGDMRLGSATVAEFWSNTMMKVLALRRLCKLSWT